jgi:hypothetical protein
MFREMSRPLQRKLPVLPGNESYAIHSVSLLESQINSRAKSSLRTLWLVVSLARCPAAKIADA